MKKKQLIGAALATALSVSLLAGCTGGGAGTTPPDPTGAPTNSGGNSAPATEQTLTIAAKETAYGSEMWNKVARAFESIHPGVTVTVLVDKNIEDVIGSQMKAGTYPDLVHLAVGQPSALTETFIKENNMEDISDVLGMTVPGENVTVSSKILPGFTDTSITMPYGDGKTYLAPTFYGPCGLFYDQGLFDQKGWTVPTTWDEMWALGDIAKAEGISLFTYPTTGYFDAFFFALMYEAGGPEFFDKATHYSEGIWDDAAAQTCFDIVEKLASYTEPTTPANANNENFTKNQQLILDNKALFMPNGNWVIGEMADAPRSETFQWGFTALPAVTAGGDRYSYTFFEQCWIPKSAENKDLAKEFIAFLYSDVATAIFAEGGVDADGKPISPAVMPVNGMTDKLDGDNKIYYSIYDTGAKAALGGFAATDPIEGVDVRSVWFDPVNSLVTGDKTREQWVDNIKSVSDQMRAALK